MSVVVDDSEWPIVVVRYTGSASADDIASYCARMDGLLARCLAHAVLVVADRSALASVARRRELTDYVIRRSDEIRRFQVAIAYVIPTPIVRGILFSLFAVVAQPTPYVVVATEEEARAWLQGRLHSSS